MTSTNFIYWLQGCSELGFLDFTKDQNKIIWDHLKIVKEDDNQKANKFIHKLEGIYSFGSGDFNIDVEGVKKELQSLFNKVTPNYEQNEEDAGTKIEDAIDDLLGLNERDNRKPKDDNVVIVDDPLLLPEEEYHNQILDCGCSDNPVIC